MNPEIREALYRWMLMVESRLRAATSKENLDLEVARNAFYVAALEMSTNEDEVCERSATFNQITFVCRLAPGHIGPHTEDIEGHSFEWK